MVAAFCVGGRICRVGPRRWRSRTAGLTTSAIAASAMMRLDRCHVSRVPKQCALDVFKNCDEHKAQTHEQRPRAHLANVHGSPHLELVGVLPGSEESRGV